jgi:hypothetical protein
VGLLIHGLQFALLHAEIFFPLGDACVPVDISCVVLLTSAATVPFRG